MKVDNTPWSKAEVNYLKQLYKMGCYQDRDIAEALHLYFPDSPKRTQSAVQGMIYRLRQKQKRKANGQGTSNISGMCG